jgi:aspartyl-tRNA(Asn)/glutamyl-tRNA(Gln) amidotransferase subunit B
MQEGSLRCDANVSVRPKGQEKFGVRAEIKNLNSFRAVEAAIEYEIAAMVALNRAGRVAEIVQCTKLWEPDTKTTRLMRLKEDAADYRYFPDPDLPPLIIDEAQLDRVRARIPELPRVREARFINELGLDKAVAKELTAEAEVADYFEALVKAGAKPRLAANWTREEAIRLANDQHKPLTVAAPLATMAKLIALVDGGKVARVEAKMDSTELFTSGEDPEAFFTRKGKIQVQDAGALAGWVAKAIEQEAKVVADVKAGKGAAIGRLIGATMKIAGGKADPNAVRAELLKQLGVAG